MYNLIVYDGYYYFTYGLDLSYNRLNVPPGYPAPGDPLQSFLHVKDPDWQLYQGFSHVIGEEGGVLSSMDGRTKISFPENALITDTTVIFVPHPQPSHTSQGLIFVDNSFDLAGVDSTGDPVSTFEVPITVTLAYTDTDIGALGEDAVGLFYWSSLEGAWVDAVTTCPDGKYTHDQAGNKLSLPVCHLTEFALFGQPLRSWLPLLRR